MTEEEFEALLAKSSVGTPQAVFLRSLCPPEVLAWFDEDLRRRRPGRSPEEHLDEGLTNAELLNAVVSRFEGTTLDEDITACVAWLMENRPAALVFPPRF